jgi:hypothetical protein
VNHNLNTILKLYEELKHKLVHELDDMKMELEELNKLIKRG